MGINDWEGDATEVRASEFPALGQSKCCGNVKTMIADKLHKVAETLGQKAAGQDESSGMAQYGKQASKFLEQSAE